MLVCMRCEQRFYAPLQEEKSRVQGAEAGSEIVSPSPSPPVYIQWDVDSRSPGYRGDTRPGS